MPAWTASCRATGAAGDRLPNFAALLCAALRPCRRPSMRAPLRARAPLVQPMCCSPTTSCAQLDKLNATLLHDALPAGACPLAYRRWAAEQVERSPDFFTKLVDQQKPEYLWCALQSQWTVSGCCSKMPGPRTCLHAVSTECNLFAAAPEWPERGACTLPCALPPPQDWLLRLPGARQRAAGAGPRRGVCAGGCCRLARAGRTLHA